MWDHLFQAITAVCGLVSALMAWGAKRASKANAQRLEVLTVQTDGLTERLAVSNRRAGHAEGKAEGKQEGVVTAKELLATNKANP